MKMLVTQGNKKGPQMKFSKINKVMLVPVLLYSSDN